MKKLLVITSLVLALVLSFAACGPVAGTEDTTADETTTLDETTTADPNGDETPGNDGDTTTADPNVGNEEPEFDNAYHVVVDTINSKGPAGAAFYPGLGASAFEFGRQEMVDAVADEIQVDARGRLKVSGWIAIFGGVNKYVYRVNGGEWIDAVGGADANASYEQVFTQFGIFSSAKNAVFQGNPITVDLSAYDGQTVTVEVACVPEIMQDTHLVMISIIDLTVAIPQLPAITAPDGSVYVQTDLAMDVPAISTLDTINGELAQKLSLHAANNAAHTVATVDGFRLDDGKIILEGWAVLEGGQENLYWSIDEYNWYSFVGGDHVDAEQGIVDAAAENGITITDVANGRFGGGICADLSQLAGKTLNVFIGVKGPNGMVEVLVMNNTQIRG